MNKEEFLYQIKKSLKYLKKDELEEIINNYSKIEINNLNPVEEANKIYKEKNINIIIPEKIKLFDAINIIINKIKTKNKDTIIDLVIFFFYIIFIAILIKIPFIYFRDMILNLFNLLFQKELHYFFFYFLIEITYSITSILIIIKYIKMKALKLKNVS